MGEQLGIEGLKTIPLKQFKDDRGAVMHILRSDASHFDKFGEVYCSLVNPGVVKAWKYHKKMTQNYSCPQGQVKVVVYDDREGSSTRGNVEEVIIGFDDYKLLIIPPNVWYGFQGVAEQASLIVNCPDLVHDPDESMNKEISDLENIYKW